MTDRHYCRHCLAITGDVCQTCGRHAKASPAIAEASAALGTDWSTLVNPIALCMYCQRINRGIYEPYQAVHGQPSYDPGSLMRHDDAVRDYLDKDLHRDPPEFRTWVRGQWWRWTRLCAQLVTDNFDHRDAIAAFVRGEGLAELPAERTKVQRSLWEADHAS